MPATDVKRPNFYEGQYLGARDLTAAQEYQRQQDQRHRLADHTWGISAGLELEERDQPGGAGTVDVYLKPGYAVDGFGRPLVVLAAAKLPESLFASFVPDPGVQQLWVRVWLRYREEKTDPPRPGYALCDSADQMYRVRETFRIVAGDLPQAAQQRDPILIDAKSLDAAAVFDDASVPYQALPDPGDSARWLVPLGYVLWSGTHFLKSADPDKVVEGRQYLGVVAETVLAPRGRVRIRVRTLDAGGSRPQDSTDFAGIEGSLRVDGAVTARQDLYVLGQAGIGTTTPASKLHTQVGASMNPVSAVTVDVQSFGTSANAQASHFLQVRDLGAGSTVFYIRGDGNIGIGTTSPNRPLSVRGRGNSQELVSFEDPNGTTKWHLNQNLAGANPGLNFVETGVADGRVFLQAGGNVGIGTTSPQQNLSVNAALNVDQANVNNGTLNPGITFGSASGEGIASRRTAGPNQYGLDIYTAGQARLSIAQNGNVGIGTAQPQALLDVAGSVRFGGRQMVQLFRLFNGADHFYTTSAAERDNAVQNGGYQDETGNQPAMFVFQ
jgi:hypothetical protein